QLQEIDKTAFDCPRRYRAARAIHARRRHAARTANLQHGATGVPRSPSPCEAVLQFMRQSLGRRTSPMNYTDVVAKKWGESFPKSGLPLEHLTAVTLKSAGWSV